MSDQQLINCTIDGVPVKAPPGTLIIEAAIEAGVYIPRFCYHKLLKPYAGCRMCLVEIPKGSERDPRPFPKPQPSCAIPVQEGMVVETQSDRVNGMRQGVMEFTLINHPLDCPICDKGGECDLQDQAYLYGREDSRFLETKLFKRNHDLSPLIVLDYNRCILCKRCIRWTEEAADDDRLIFTGRGNRMIVATFNDTTFTSRFGGMTIELCPVGALTSQVFRFKARPWETGIRSSTCAECANGCSFNASFRQDRIMRLLSCEDKNVNGAYFCDRGRFAHDYLENDDRLVKPMKRDGNKFVAVTWEEAASIMASAFKTSVQNHGEKSVAGCIDPSESLEALWAFSRLMTDGFGTPRIEHAPAPWAIDPNDSYALLNRLPSLEKVWSSKNIVLWEADAFDDSPVLGLQLKVLFENKLIDGISIATLRSFIGRHGLDERIVNPIGRRAILAGVISRFAAKCSNVPDALKSTVDAARKVAGSLSAEEIKIADDVVARLSGNDSVLIIGSSILKTKNREFAALTAMSGLREAATGEKLNILPSFRSANSLASMLIGLRTRFDAGGPLKFSGESVLDWPEEIEKGRIKAVFAVGDGLTEAIGENGLERLGSLDFLAVVTDFMNPLAIRADLVIPRLSPWEISGTLVNLAGNIRRMKEIVAHPTGGWRLEQFLAKVGEEIRVDIPVESEDIRKELGVFNKAFKPLADSKALRIDIENDAKFRFAEAEHAFDNLNAPDDGEFGMILNETVFQHDSRGVHSEHIAAMPEEFCVGMSRADARKIGVSAGDKVKISSDDFSMTAPVKTIKCPNGYVVLPLGFRDASVANLDIWRNPELRFKLEKIEAEVATAK